MENKIFWKNISVDCVFYGFNLEIGLHFYFHYKPFSGLRHAKRERERERVPDPPKTDRTPASAPPSRSNHHRDFTPDQSHPIKIASPSKTDPPKTDLIGTVVTHDQSHHPLIVTDDQSRCPLDLVLISSLPMTDLVAHEP